MHIASPSRHSLLSRMEKLRLCTGSLLPRSCGDAEPSSRGTEGRWDPAMCPGQQHKSHTCLRAFLFIFILKEKKKNSAKTHFPVSAMPTPHPQVTPLAQGLMLPPSQHPLPSHATHRGWRLCFPGGSRGTRREERTGGQPLIRLPPHVSSHGTRYPLGSH